MISVRRALLPLLALAASAALHQAPTAVAASPTSEATPGQSTYVPVAPYRVLDTRNGTGGRLGSVGTGGFVDLPLGLPSGATAAILNVTATGATGETVIRVFPTPTSGTAAPLVSNLNVVKGGTVADLVVSKIGSQGRVRLLNSAGQVHLVADLAGYYVSGGSGDGFTGTAPVRLLDTRTAGVPLLAGEPRTLDVLRDSSGNPSGVPSAASAVVLNLTAVAPSTNTVLRAYPGSSAPVVSNLNPAKGTTVANLAVVKTSEGTVTLLNAAGSTHLVVDLAGWYLPGEGDVFHPVDPYRALDTRTTSSPVQAGAPRSLTLAGAGQVTWSGSSVAMTITAVKPATGTYVTAYPQVRGSSAPPLGSNLNLSAGQVVPNAAVVAVGDEGAIRLSNYARQVHLVVDVSGWFGPPGEGYDISWPQCSPSRTSSTSTHPATGAFAVIGLTNGKPYTRNACLADQFAWAESLPGGGSGYIILNAPGEGDANWGAHRSPQVCDGKTTVGCGYDYGWWTADFALQGLPATSTGGRPQVWLDVEGPYSSGPVWQPITTSQGQAVNAAVVRGARDRLRTAGVRTGVYSRKRTTNGSGIRTDDWYRLTGGLALTNVQQWVFPRNQTAGERQVPPVPATPEEVRTGAAAACAASYAFTGGWMVLSQYQTVVNGTTYDTNHPC